MAQTPPRLPDFLILGEMKCGSTTLWELLSRHPRIYFPEEKELHYFNERPDRAAASLAEYAAWFAAAPPDRLAGEATPNYLFDADAGLRIRETLPDVRLIAILRDPVVRAWSHYWHNVRRGREPLGFEQALDAEPQRLAADAVGRLHFSYASRGRYVESLEGYAALFGRERLCVVLLEDLTSRAESVMRQVFAHLGLDPPAELSLAPSQSNRASYPRWPWLDRGIRRLRRGVLDRHPRLAAPLLALGRRTRAWRTYSGAPQMRPATRARLLEGYAESDAELARWLGREPPWRR